MNKRRQLLLSGGAPDFDMNNIGSVYGWWRADKASTLTVDGSNKVTSWREYTTEDPTKTWAMSSGSAPSYNPAKAATGKPALDFIKAAQLYMQNSMSKTAGNMSIWLMIDRQNATGSTENLFSTQTGPLVLSSISGTTGYSGYYDTSWKQGVNIISGTQALGFQYSGTGGTSGVVYRGFTSLGSFTYSVARPFGGTTALGSYYDGSAQWFDGCIYELVIFNEALTFAQRSNLLTYWGTKYNYDPNA